MQYSYIVNLTKEAQMKIKTKVKAKTFNAEALDFTNGLRLIDLNGNSWT